MKTIRTAAVVAALATATVAGAQSSVSVYGVLDVGAQQTSNAQGGKLNRLESRHEPSYLGFRGSEDLGDGMSAVFRLESSVAVDTGTSNATTFFSRQAFVGLESRRWGSLTLGRQYDTIIDLVGVDPARFNSVTAVHGGNWDRSSGTYVNNAVKYRSPTFGGFSGTVLRVLGEGGTSATNAGRAYGASLNYAQGSLRVSTSYLQIDGVTHRPLNDLGVDSAFGLNFRTTAANVVTNDTIWGVGAFYDFANLRALGLYTETKAKAIRNGRVERVKAGGIGLIYNPVNTGFRPSFGINRASLDNADWTTIYGILDYYLSRRTDVYFRVLSQKATGGARAALYLEGPSSNTRQTVIGAGITHRF